MNQDEEEMEDKDISNVKKVILLSVTVVFSIAVFLLLCCCGIIMCIYKKYRDCWLDYEEVKLKKDLFVENHQSLLKIENQI